MCETRDLGIKCTLLFEGHVLVDKSGLPTRRKEDASEASQGGLLEKVGSKARV